MTLLVLVSSACLLFFFFQEPCVVGVETDANPGHPRFFFGVMLVARERTGGRPGGRYCEGTNGVGKRRGGGVSISA